MLCYIADMEFGSDKKKGTVMDTIIKKQAIIHNALRADDATNEDNPGDSVTIIMQCDDSAPNSINVTVKRIGVDFLNAGDIACDNVAMFFNREIGDMSDDDQVYKALKELYNDITDAVRDYYRGRTGFILLISNGDSQTKFDEAFCVNVEDMKAYRVFWCKDMPGFMKSVTNKDWFHWNNIGFCDDDDDEDWDE